MKGFTPINLAFHCIREFIMIHYMDLPYLSRFIVILYMVLQYLRGVIIIHYMDLAFLRGVIMIVHLQLGSNLRSLVRSKGFCRTAQSFSSSNMKCLLLLMKLVAVLFSSYLKAMWMNY
uniref:Uncharacterized protein n=1 Tax=Aegilops tauschii subsp. strangulata TaxID=200361 RepID=A0A453QS55_AEGTS